MSERRPDSPPAPADLAPDRRRVRAAFERRGPVDEAAGFVAERSLTELMARLDLVRLAPSLILDLGAGSGRAAERLARHYRRARVIAVDLAAGPLAAARRRGGWRRPIRAVSADAARLPLASGSVDLVVSNLMLPWCGDPEPVFVEARRVLRPDGLLTFSTLGPDTLRELRTAWAAVDAHPRVLPFLDMHDIGDALVRAGLADPVMDVDTVTVEYRDFDDLVADLRAVGAGNVAAGRPRGLTGPARWRAVRDAYEAAAGPGRLAATVEIVYGHAWGGAAARGARARDGVVEFPLERLSRRPRGG